MPQCGISGGPRQSAGERVARELAEQIDLIEYGPEHRGFFEIEEVTKLLAAVLAACARERDRSNREYYKEVLNKAKLSAAAWKIHETPILSEAERAAGERAGDLRVKS